MATITKPMALDESFNTTESTSRNQADVLVGIEQAIVRGFGQVANAVSYDNTDSGLTADNVQDAIDEVDDTVDGLVDDVAEISSDIDSTQTISGNPITLTDCAQINAESLVVELEPKQEGSGDPSPTNVRPITGYTECEVETADSATDPTITNTATIQFGQTVFGGTVDFKTGELTVDRAVKTITGSESGAAITWDSYSFKVNDGIDSNSEISVYESSYSDDALTGSEMYSSRASGHDYGYCVGSGRIMRVRNRNLTQDLASYQTWFQSNTIQVCYKLATPQTYQLTPADLKLLQGTNYITTNGTTITLGYQPDNVIGEVKGEIEKCSPNPEFMHFEVNENVVDAIPIIFDEAIHSYTVSGDNWKDKTFLCVECCDMRYGILQRVLSSDMAFVDSCGKALMLYPYMRSIKQYIKITISLGQSYGYEISYQTTNTSSLLDYLKIRVRLFN